MTRVRVVLLARAEQDLKELRSYILKSFPLQTWQKTYGQLKEAIGKLATFSHHGAMLCLF